MQCELFTLVNRWRARARTELVYLHNRHCQQCDDDDSHSDLQDIKRGIRLIRAEPTGEHESVAYERWRALVELGAQIHVVPPADYTLLVVDRRVAVLGHRLGHDCAAPTVITTPGLVRGLAAMVLERITFGRTLSERACTEAPVVLAPIELRVLKLLDECDTEVEISRRVGVSDRQLRRYLQRLQDTLGARNRFQLGLRAAESGLFGPRRTSDSGHQSQPGMASPGDGCPCSSRRNSIPFPDASDVPGPAAPRRPNERIHGHEHDSNVERSGIPQESG